MDLILSGRPANVANATADVFGQTKPCRVTRSRCASPWTRGQVEVSFPPLPATHVIFFHQTPVGKNKTQNCKFHHARVGLLCICFPLRSRNHTSVSFIMLGWVFCAEPVGSSSRPVPGVLSRHGRRGWRFEGRGDRLWVSLADGEAASLRTSARSPS